jgi:LmbE family N-acetylglucosaminyl deacetylase
MSEIVAVAALLALALGLVAFAITCFAIARWHEAATIDVIRDVLVLSPHPDDCVIMAGEYGTEASRTGRTVTVVYLTSGDPDPEGSRASVRRAESVEAWGKVGVPASSLHYLALPNSPLAGPLLSTPAQTASARQRLAELVTALPAQSALIFPAAGESHADHRLARRIAWEALRAANRQDLTLLEAAEYNDLYSLRSSPARTLRYVLGSLPMLGRITGDRRPPRHGFANGDGLCLPRDDERMATKLSMLRCFVSENGEMLVRLFGWPDRLRSTLAIAPDESETLHGYMSVGQRRLHWSTLTLWLALYLGAFAGSASLAIAGMARAPVARFVVAGMLCGALVLALLRRAPLERKLMLAVVAAGACAALLA